MGEIGSIRLKSGVDVRDFAKALTAVDGLVTEVAKEMGIDPESVVLKVGAGRIVCDGEGCGRDQPGDSTGWVARDGLDFCPECAAGEGSETPQ